MSHHVDIKILVTDTWMLKYCVTSGKGSILLEDQLHMTILLTLLCVEQGDSPPGCLVRRKEYMVSSCLNTNVSTQSLV